MQDDKGFCKQLSCGTSTYSGALPACPADTLNKKVAAGVDSKGDGCADPYKKDGAGECSIKGQWDENNPPKLPELETMCVVPGTRTLTPELAGRLTQAGKTPGVAQGECEECGRGGMIPCNGADFGGCFVNEGFILNEKTVRSSACVCVGIA